MGPWRFKSSLKWWVDSVFQSSTSLVLMSAYSTRLVQKELRAGQIISTDVQVAQLCFESCTALHLSLRSRRPVGEPFPIMLRGCQLQLQCKLTYCNCFFPPHTAPHSCSYLYSPVIYYDLIWKYCDIAFIKNVPLFSVETEKKSLI